MESDPRKQKPEGRERKGRSLLPQWESSCAGASEKCAEPPRIVLVKEGDRNIYPQLPALHDGEPPGVEARHQGLPTLPSALQRNELPPSASAGL